ncbi:hypothetical protein U1Q18_052654 [Sarracenia purpurea var. burkii]
MRSSDLEPPRGQGQRLHSDIRLDPGKIHETPNPILQNGLVKSTNLLVRQTMITFPDESRANVFSAVFGLRPDTIQNGLMDMDKAPLVGSRNESPNSRESPDSGYANPNPTGQLEQARPRHRPLFKENTDKYAQLGVRTVLALLTSV